MAGLFPYQSTLYDPPAPACDVIVSSGNRSESVSGLIDSGADITCIPETLVRNLSLAKKGKIDATGAVGGTQQRGIYIVDLNFLSITFRNYPVISLPRDYILIGRDILNRYIATLDGPQGQFSIE